MEATSNSQKNSLPIAKTDDIPIISKDTSLNSYPTLATKNSLPQSSLIASSNLPERDRLSTILATAVVFVKNSVGSLIPCRAILDSASQAHFITANFVNKLQLKPKRSTTQISGISQSNFASGKIVNIFIQSRTTKCSAWVTSIVVPTIVEHQPPYSMDVSNWNIPNQIKLADPLFYKSQQVDLLIGGDLFFESLCSGKIQIGSGLPLLQETKFGWVVAGGGIQLHKSNSCLINVHANEKENNENNLKALVRRF